MELGVESLNAALATGIALYEWQRSRKKELQARRCK
jgi:tRNA G18 (ribose-2'-O)-methylase SpoU